MISPLLSSSFFSRRCIFTAYELSVVVCHNISSVVKSLDDFLGGQIRCALRREPGGKVAQVWEDHAPCSSHPTEVTASRLIIGSVHPPVTQAAFHVLLAGAAPTAGITGAQAARGIAGTGSVKETGQEEGVQQELQSGNSPFSLEGISLSFPMHERTGGRLTQGPAPWFLLSKGSDLFTHLNS